MPIALRPISQFGTPAGRLYRGFYEMVFSGDYATGGDTVSLDLVNAADQVVFNETQSLPVGRPPADWTLPSVSDAAASGDYTFDLVLGSKAFDFKVKVYQAGAELAAGAYPAALTTPLPVPRLSLRFRQNI